MFHLINLYSYVRVNNKNVKADILDLDYELARPHTQDEVEYFLRRAEHLLGKFELDIVGISCWTSL